MIEETGSSPAPPQPPRQEAIQAVPVELSAADRAVAREVGHISSSEQWLRVAGVTEEQIQAARANAEKQVRAQYKELEDQDPLSRITTALRTAAQTEQERTLVDLDILNLEGSRRGLAEVPREPRRMFGQSVSGIEIDSRRAEDGNMTARVVLPVLYPNGGQGLIITPSHELQERFLRNLGVLEEDQLYSDLLGSNPRRYKGVDQESGPTPTGPLLETTRGGDELMTQLPTNIDGIEARINYRESEIAVSIAPKILPKIQPPAQPR